jgi:hypothetical protein
VGRRRGTKIRRDWEEEEEKRLRRNSGTKWKGSRERRKRRGGRSMNKNMNKTKNKNKNKRKRRRLRKRIRDRTWWLRCCGRKLSDKVRVGGNYAMDLYRQVLFLLWSKLVSQFHCFLR